MAEEKGISMSEMRKTIATSLGAAFGFVIGLLWSNVVLGGIATAGINLSPGSAAGNWGGWGYLVVTALGVTIVMIVLIIVVGRWGSKA
jgi:hypothetical protein